ncbi:glycosyltransferase family 4 protein [Symbiobacterium thermophilum]|uniref:Group 1 glycosyl transferase n=1 Tax=Symbiobacterium thermophilum TaxID=2734 RepID=A0A953LIT5_SYMTR|nr:glycosyltransferase family 4 protein [Symbiobacterium thermophilum]MBY6275062.1 group 1 glycosyl transferase [Symbiobacterium thermophilum]
MTKDMPNILLAAMALDLGGAETHVISLARELHRRGHRVVVASAGGRMVPMLTERGIPHIVVPMASRNPLAMARAYWLLRRLIAEHRIGLVHAHARIPAWLCALAVRGRGIPLVTTYHGVYNAGFPWKYLTTFGQRAIAVSEDVRRHLEGPLGAPPEIIRVIPNGFETGEFRPGLDIGPLLRELGVDRTGPHVVHASRLTDEFADTAVALLQALPRLNEQFPTIRLWILGDGNRYAEVARLADEVNRRLGREAARAVGHRLDVPAFFNLADCVVAVARTATEAMLCERPVIIAGEGGYRGILTPERIPLYAGANFTAREGGTPLNPAVLAEDIASLLAPGKEVERQRLGRAGREFVVASLSIESVTARILDVYAEVL